MDKETKDNTNIPLTALISLIATGTIGIVVSATLFVSLLIYYHKCYKVPIRIWNQGDQLLDYEGKDQFWEADGEIL